MEVNNNINIDTAQWVKVNQARQRASQSGADTTSFYRVEALDQAMKATPAVRPEAVERAKKLIAEIRYPGDETIRGIASLLALKIEPTKES
jgi:hypothetical protein